LPALLLPRTPNTSYTSYKPAAEVDPVVLVVASVWTTYVGVLQDKIGLVIGKGGDTIKSINQASGADAQVETDKRAPLEAHEKKISSREQRFM